MKHPDVVFQDSKFAMYKNHPDKENIDWKYMTKEEYLKHEAEFFEDALLFEPFLIEEFYTEEEFNELRDFLQSKPLTDIAYTKQMNKWEDHVALPQKFIDIAIENVKKALGTDDVELGYYLFAHHQITKEGQKPFLQVHMDWSPGTYMVDLHLGGNRDWSIVCHDKEFVTKPNQAVLVQPEIDLHYREPWNNDDPNEYYQAVFFHLIRKKHWKNKYGIDYQFDQDFLNFQMQRLEMFESLYFDLVDSNPDLPVTTIGNDTAITEDDKRLFGIEKA
jgi:hypothetical protein